MLKQSRARCLTSVCHSVFVVVVSGALLVGCAKKTADTATTPTGAAAVSTNLTSINSNFAPASLSYGTSSAVRVGLNPKALFEATEGGNPCAGYDLFGCQPVLLRLYIAMAKQFFGVINETVSDVKANIDAVADGGTLTDQAIEDGFTMSLSKTTASVFKFLIKNSTAQPAVYLDVKDTAYSMKMDLAAVTGGATTATFSVDVAFTDETHWNMTLLIAGMPCDENDTRAPRTIRIYMARAADLWSGKAQLYNPIWAYGLGTDNSPTCTTTATDATSIHINTDFVADALAAKASVYMMQSDKTDMSGMDDWAMSEMCTNFLEGSLNGMTCAQFYTYFPMNTYVNPFCNPDSTDQAVWNDSCASSSTAVSGASFGAATDWIPPAEFATVTVTMPTSL